MQAEFITMLYLVASLFLLYVLYKWLMRHRHAAPRLPISVKLDRDIPATVSIIMPVLNETKVISDTLAPLQAMRAAGHELIVVDGGSTDDTLGKASALADMSLSSTRGRARQMNSGAMQASGDVLLFLHADTRLPVDGIPALLKELEKSGKIWGRFDVRLSGRHPLLRVVACMMNWRSRITGIATGDQAMFVRREAFQALNGFPDIPLMEDIALSSALQSGFGRPLCLRKRVVTSSRRWQEGGILRTIMLMWKLRLAYFLGASPERLARQYTRRETANEHV
jgi:rSAM/selenodomain-associated transferase 2